MSTATPATTAAPDTSVIGRVFALLRAFSQSGRAELSLAQLTKSTGLPKSTIHRTVGQLLEADVLERTAHGYRLGLAMFELGSLVPRQRRLREVALPYMEDLYELTHETIHFGVLDQNEVLYIERIHGHESVDCATRIGGRMPLHCTGLGKSLLAWCADTMVEDVVRAGLPRRTPYTITQSARLREDLAEIRKRGLALDREEAVPGVNCVAAPILNRSNGPVAAISVTARSLQRAERWATAVQQSAHRLTKAVRQMPDSFWQQSDLVASLTESAPTGPDSSGDRAEPAVDEQYLARDIADAEKAEDRIGDV